MQTELNNKLKEQFTAISNTSYCKLAPSIHIIKNLLIKGADINTQDKNGNTLLHVLAKDAKKIIGYNAYINNTLLVNPKLLEQYQFQLSDLISKYNPNPFIKNKEGLTASFIAAKENQTQFAQILLSYENSYHAKMTAQAIEALTQISNEQQFKKVEQLVQEENGDFIIERYHSSDHQPQSVLVARDKITKITQNLKGSNQRS